MALVLVEFCVLQTCSGSDWSRHPSVGCRRRALDSALQSAFSMRGPVPRLAVADVQSSCKRQSQAIQETNEDDAGNDVDDGEGASNAAATPAQTMTGDRRSTGARAALLAQQHARCPGLDDDGSSRHRRTHTRKRASGYGPPRGNLKASGCGTAGRTLRPAASARRRGALSWKAAARHTVATRGGRALHDTGQGRRVGFSASS